MTEPRRSSITQSGASSGSSSGSGTGLIEQLTDAATVTPDAGGFSGGYLASLSQTTAIANPTGSPGEFSQYMLRITSASSRSLTFGSYYRATTAMALPTATTGGGKTDYFGFQWNAFDGTWDMLAKSTGY